MKFENVEVTGFDAAIRGMRNPKNSWDKSDSYFGLINFDHHNICADLAVTKKWMKAKFPTLTQESEEYTKTLFQIGQWLEENGILKINDEDHVAEIADIGPADMKLAQTLVQSGPEHCKFLRQIFVSVDITAPLYFFKEFDTYKVGTTANSTSTMHKLTANPITKDCFEMDDFKGDLIIEYGEDGATGEDVPWKMSEQLECIIEFLEDLRQKYIETKDTRYWKELVRWLPESWLQTRTWTGSYANLRNMCKQRKDHKLTEWHQFIDWARTLPYANELIFLGY